MRHALARVPTMRHALARAAEPRARAADAQLGKRHDAALGRREARQLDIGG